MRQPSCIHISALQCNRHTVDIPLSLFRLFILHIDITLQNIKIAQKPRFVEIAQKPRFVEYISYKIQQERKFRIQTSSIDGLEKPQLKTCGEL